MSLTRAYVIVADLDHQSTNVMAPVNTFPLVTGMTAADGEDRTRDSLDVFKPPFVYDPADETGHQRRTSFDDWYFRIHFDPNLFNFGNLSGTQERAMVLWNAFLEPVSFTDFTLVNGQGVMVESDATPPMTIPALGLIPYTVTVDGVGPAVVNAQASWTIDGITYDIPITGRRTTLFSFPPNWNAQVRETLEWKTSVNSSFNRIEQRMRLRDVPRRVFEYQMRIHNDVMRLFDETTFGWVGRMYSMPLWHEKCKLTAAAAAGATTIYLDTAGATFDVGSNAILYTSPLFGEPLEVLEVHPDHLVLANSLANDWPKGSPVFPVLACAPPETFATTRRSATHLDTAVRFLASPVDCIPRLPEVEPDGLYRGEEIYLRSTNWRMAMNVSIEGERTEVDNSIGPYRLKQRADFPLILRGMSWMLKSRAAAEELRAFFVRRQGRLRPAWMPSGMVDFVMKDDTGPGQTSLLVRNSQYASLTAMHEARRDIVIFLNDDSVLTRRITNVEQVGADSLLHVDAAFDTGLAKADVRRISYLGLYRLGSDAVTFAWYTDQVCEVDVQLVLTKPWEGA